MKTKKEILLVLEQMAKEQATHHKTVEGLLQALLRDLGVKTSQKGKDAPKNGFVEKKPEKATSQRTKSEYIGLNSVYMWLKNQGYDVTYSVIKNACIDRDMVMLWKPASEKAKDQSSGNWYLLKTQAIELEKDIIQGRIGAK